MAKQKKLSNLESQKETQIGELSGLEPMIQPDNSNFNHTEGKLKVVDESISHDKSETVAGIQAGKSPKFRR